MHRGGFEKVCDVIAYLQTSMHEGVQWAFTALFFGSAAVLLLGTMVSA